MPFPDYKCSLLKPIYLTITYFRVSLNLIWKYFAGLKFRDFDESPFFKVIKFRESICVLFLPYRNRNATSNRKFRWNWLRRSTLLKRVKLSRRSSSSWSQRPITEQDADGKFEDNCTEEVLHAGTNSARWVRWWGIRTCVELKFELSYSYIYS